MAQNLIIIDLQDSFLETKPKQRVESLKQGVLKQIRLAKSGKKNIVVVEYLGEGRTSAWVKQALGKYTRVFFCHKSINDASTAISRLVKKHGLPERHRVCGVNTRWCVGETITSMVKKNHVVEVPFDAVECGSSRASQKRFLESSGVRIL